MPRAQQDGKMQKSKTLSVLFELRSMLREMERDVGLHDLSGPEMDVLLAAHDVTKKCGDVITSEQIWHHELAAELAQATYHRALKSLQAMGFLAKARGYKSGRYVLQNTTAFIKLK